LDNDEARIKEQQEAFRQEAINRGAAFEEMTKSKGWELVKAFIENKVKTFANGAIVAGFENMETFNLERGKVEGLRQLLSEIESSMTVLRTSREEDHGT